VRRSIQPPVGGGIRNGALATVVSVDAERERVVLRVGDERVIPVSREYIDRADLRLAYVHHPFPAQGQTSDTTHLIIGDHANREGTYVGLTRGRGRTQIYTSLEQLNPGASDVGLLALADAVGRAEPCVPSIQSPLALEAATAEGEADETQEPGVAAAINAKTGAESRTRAASTEAPASCGWRRRQRMDERTRRAPRQHPDRVGGAR
jgi:hypothetical protein